MTYNMSKSKTCEFCKNIFYKRTDYTNKAWEVQKYCSSLCYRNFLSKNPIRYWLGKKRFKNSEENPFFGKKHSLETRRKMTEAKLKSPTKMFGANNPQWKGGISKEYKRIRSSSDFRKWREQVFERDDYTCQKCYIRGGKLHPHHKLNFSEYPDLRFVIDNGLTFCEDCHKKFHKEYGNKRNNLFQIVQFLC